MLALTPPDCGRWSCHSSRRRPRRPRFRNPWRSPTTAWSARSSPSAARPATAEPARCRGLTSRPIRGCWREASAGRLSCRATEPIALYSRSSPAHRTTLGSYRPRSSSWSSSGSMPAPPSARPIDRIPCLQTSERARLPRALSLISEPCPARGIPPDRPVGATFRSVSGPPGNLPVRHPGARALEPRSRLTGMAGSWHRGTRSLSDTPFQTCLDRTPPWPGGGCQSMPFVAWCPGSICVILHIPHRLG